MAMSAESGAKRLQKALAEGTDLAYPARKSAFGRPGDAHARFIVKKRITSARP
jgi:hypothetical protein